MSEKVFETDEIRDNPEQANGIFREFIIRKGPSAMPKMIYDDRLSSTLLPKALPKDGEEMLNERKRKSERRDKIKLKSKQQKLNRRERNRKKQEKEIEKLFEDDLPLHSLVIPDQGKLLSIIRTSQCVPSIQKSFES